MSEILQAATKDLLGSVAPEDFSLAWGDRSELVRNASRQFIQSISIRAGHEFSSELLMALNEVSAQSYEGRAGAGRLVLTASDSAMVDLHVQFTEPVRLSETRSVRKALEMTGPQLHLLCDGEKLLGLAKVHDGYDPGDESLFQIEVIARGAWELHHHDVPLLRVSNSRPTLPEPRIDERYFNDVVLRTFPECENADVARLWKLAVAAADAEHGTMLVVHRDAAGEASRLRPQSQLVVPTPLSIEVLETVTSIDGAVLVDPQGNCHAVGVILDGLATGTGDPSRGARFNSAVRYEAAQRPDVLVIVVSEDGMINLQPNLRRRVARHAVENAVQMIEVEAAGDDPDFEQFFRYWELMEAHSFYLSASQCDRVNAARQALEDHRSASSLIVLSWMSVSPDPDMDDSYFLD